MSEAGDLERLIQRGRERGVAEKPTRYAIICPEHGQVYLTRENYNAQMADPDSRWVCPWCGSISEFDDDNYDAVSLEEDGPGDNVLLRQLDPPPRPFGMLDKDDPGRYKP